MITAEARPLLRTPLRINICRRLQIEGKFRSFRISPLSSPIACRHSTLFWWHRVDMAALQARCLQLHGALASRTPRSGRFLASLQGPTNGASRDTAGNRIGSMPALLNVEELLAMDVTGAGGKTITQKPLQRGSVSEPVDGCDLHVVSKLYVIMEAAADRARMHDAIGVQRDNWNHLLLNSLNAITLTASVAAGLAGIPVGDATTSHVAFKTSSALLYSAATVMLLVVNKIQPSQLAEEQRNAARLFRKLEKNIQTTLTLGKATPAAVENALDQVLALDKAYPLSLLPGMLEKFPKIVEPTVWWPKWGRLRRQRQSDQQKFTTKGADQGNGWTRGLEEVMTGVLGTLKKKDTDEYVRLGRLALSINTVMAMAGPAITGSAAIGAGLMDSAFLGHWPLTFAVVGGALATVVNSLEHGGQIGMIFELFRNCAGFYKHLEEEIEFNLDEPDAQKRENGELFELRMALQLGRSLSELRSLSSVSSRREHAGGEHAGKLF